MQTPKIWKSAMKRSPLAPETVQTKGRGASVDHSTATKKSGTPTRGCMCAPTTHPGSFRCRYHRSIGIVKWQPADTKKPLVVAKILISPSLPPPIIERRRRTAGPSRLRCVTFADSPSETGTEEEYSGPLRFLKQLARAVGSGAGEKRCEDIAMSNPGAASCRTDRFYEAKNGDTLSSIARQCGCSIPILSTVNHLTTDVIYPGQKLWIPVAYEIEEGDSLLLISRRFKTTIGDIMKMNRIKHPNSIQAGDIILLP